MKVIGGLLAAFGLVDMIGSFIGLDVWGEWIRVDLPDAVWSSTAYIEIGIGCLLFNMGSKGPVNVDDDDSQGASEPSVGSDGE
jgi:hypothetical protein